jgi:hypothetical protein
MKYKNTTKGVIYLKDGVITKAVSPGEEFETENLIKISGISLVLPAKKPTLAKKPKKVAIKIKEMSDVRSTED